MGITFVADIPKDATLYIKKPRVFIPENKGARGRKNTQYKVKGKSTTAEEVGKKVQESEFKNITLRTTQKGKPVKAKYWKVPVFLALKQEGAVLEVVFVVRKDTDGAIKYFLTNANNESLSRIAYMHGQRYFIERTFQEAKQQLGMGDYQVRGYYAWHRHMAMSALAMLFLQTEKYLYLTNNLSPSTPQLAKIIMLLLPQKIITLQDILKTIPAKKQRKSKRKQKKKCKKSVT